MYKIFAVFSIFLLGFFMDLRASEERPAAIASSSTMSPPEMSQPIPASSSSQVVQAPLVTVPEYYKENTTPTTFVVSLGGKLYVGDNRSYTVSVVNMHSNQVIATIEVGGSPGVPILAEDKLYVLNEYSRTVSVIDRNSYQLRTTIKVRGRPDAAVPIGGKLYVLNKADGTISVINTITNEVVKTISVGENVLAPIPVEDKLYVLNKGDRTISVINTITNEVVSTISVGKNALAPIPVEDKLYVLNKADGTISVINTITNEVVSTINVGGIPLSAVPVGGKLYMLNSIVDAVSVIDTTLNQVTATINVGQIPVAAVPAGNTLYVLNKGDRTISVIDMRTNQVSATIQVAHDFAGAVPVGNNLYLLNEYNNTISVLNFNDETPNNATHTRQTVRIIENIERPLRASVHNGKMYVIGKKLYIIDLAQVDGLEPHPMQFLDPETRQATHNCPAGLQNLLADTQTAHNFGYDFNKMTVLTSLEKLKQEYESQFNKLRPYIISVVEGALKDHEDDPKLADALKALDPLKTQPADTYNPSRYPAQYPGYKYQASQRIGGGSFSILDVLTLVWIGMHDKDQTDYKAEEDYLINQLYEVYHAYANHAPGNQWSCPNGYITRLLQVLESAHSAVEVSYHAVREEYIKNQAERFYQKAVAEVLPNPVQVALTETRLFLRDVVLPPNASKSQPLPQMVEDILKTVPEYIEKLATNPGLILNNFQERTVMREVYQDAEDDKLQQTGASKLKIQGDIETRMRELLRVAPGAAFTEGQKSQLEELTKSVYDLLPEYTPQVAGAAVSYHPETDTMHVKEVPGDR